MRAPFYRTRTDISENTMTSMIDVVFLLLIFFVVAAAGQTQESLLPTDLGAGSSGTQTIVDPVKPPPIHRDEVWIYLTVDGMGNLGMKLNGTDYDTFEALKATLLALAQVAPDSPVVLDIAPEVEASQMIRVYDTCRAAKFTSVNFNARSQKPKPQP